MLRIVKSSVSSEMYVRHACSSACVCISVGKLAGGKREKGFKVKKTNKEKTRDNMEKQEGIHKSLFGQKGQTPVTSYL